MKVHELVEVLKDVNPSSEVNIHIYQQNEALQSCHDGKEDYDPVLVMPGREYILVKPKVVVDNGWHGLITIELGEILGDG